MAKHLNANALFAIDFIKLKLILHKKTIQMKVYSRNFKYCLGGLPFNKLKGRYFYIPYIDENEKLLKKVKFEIKKFMDEQVLIAWCNIDYEKIKQNEIKQNR